MGCFDLRSLWYNGRNAASLREILLRADSDPAFRRFGKKVADILESWSDVRAANIEKTIMPPLTTTPLGSESHLFKLAEGSGGIKTEADACPRLHFAEMIRFDAVPSIAGDRFFGGTFGRATEDGFMQDPGAFFDFGIPGNELLGEFPCIIMGKGIVQPPEGLGRSGAVVPAVHGATTVIKSEEGKHLSDFDSHAERGPGRG